MLFNVSLYKWFVCQKALYAASGPANMTLRQHTLKYRAVKFLLALFLTIKASCFGELAQAEANQEYIVRAGLTLNFARFTTWPANAQQATSNTINLCLIGNPDIEDAFGSLNGKTVADKKIQVRYLTRFNSLAECQILYVSDFDKNKLQLLLNEIKTLPILTVGEEEFFINNGGIVSLQIIDGKVSISVNVKAAKTSNLSISARVLKLATVIQ